MRHPLRLGVVYDFRNPPESGMTTAALYGAILEQVTMLDGLGLDLPFNHPIRLAEDLAVLDNISNGRVEIGVGMGYAPHEFKGFGIPVSRRVSLTDEALAALRLAFTGETFSFKGKRYDFQEVKITPGYVQPGGPPLWVAAMSEPGAQRAARFNANLLPQGPRARSLDTWAATMREQGGDPGDYRIGIIRSCLVTDDADRDWAEVRAGERRRMAVYEKFRAESGRAGGLDPPRPLPRRRRLPPRSPGARPQYRDARRRAGHDNPGRDGARPRRRAARHRAERGRAGAAHWMDAGREGKRRSAAGGRAERLARRRQVGRREHGTRNDVALLLSPHGTSVATAVFYTEAPGPAETRERVIAAVGRIVAGAFSGTAG